MFLSCVLLSLPLVIADRDISWFKDTTCHYENILQIQNSWSQCQKWDEYNNISGESTVTALCKTLQVPLDWDDETLTQTINYTIARIYSYNDIENKADNGAFWMIQGGPGYPPYTLYEEAIPWQTFTNGTYDIYIPDHRGMAYSTIMTCPYIPLSQNCSEYTSNLWGNNSYFSTYQAAFDLGYAIDLLSGNFSAYNGDNHFIYAVSYGTYYTNKYLQLFPNQVNGVILDGICVSDECRTVNYDKATHETAVEFFKRCGSNSWCNAQFVPEYGDDIIDAIEHIYTLFDDNNGSMPCNPLNDIFPVTTGLFQQILFFMFQNEYKRMMILPLLKRIARCNQNDTIAIVSFLTWASDLLSAPDPTNNVLLANIGLSELWYGNDPINAGPDSPDIVTLAGLLDEYYIASGISVLFKTYWDGWDKYIPPLDLYSEYSDASMPILLINGDLDPQTNVTWARIAANNFNANEVGTNRYYVELSNVAHGVFIKSAIVNYTDDDALFYQRDYETCGMYVVKSFIDDPYSEPDTRCLDWLISLDWSTSSNVSIQLAQVIFGTSGAWGDIEQVIDDEYNTTFQIDNANIINLPLMLLLAIGSSLFLAN